MNNSPNQIAFMIIETFPYSQIRKLEQVKTSPFKVKEKLQDKDL
jgi:hypothetical protein